MVTTCHIKSILESIKFKFHTPIKACPNTTKKMKPGNNPFCFALDQTFYTAALPVSNYLLRELESRKNLWWQQIL